MLFFCFYHRSAYFGEQDGNHFEHKKRFTNWTVDESISLDLENLGGGFGPFYCGLRGYDRLIGETPGLGYGKRTTINSLERQVLLKYRILIKI